MSLVLLTIEQSHVCQVRTADVDQRWACQVMLTNNISDEELVRGIPRGIQTLTIRAINT
jgi:hypothetical protein